MSTTPQRFFILASMLAVVSLTAASATVRVNGSTTVNPVVVEAAHLLRIEEGLEILIDTAGGSSGGIVALGDGRVDIAMSSRSLNKRDSERFPAVAFYPTRIGTDALALVVSKDVWEGGVRSLTKDETRRLYEGEIQNWQDLGGPDKRVVFFNKEPSRGTWEVFANWLYGESNRAPLVSLPEVGSNEEGRNKVATTPGAITQLSAAWADGERVFALSLRAQNGSLLVPSREQITSGSYPLARPLLLLTNGFPTGDTKRLIDFLLGPRGRPLLERHGYLAAKKDFAVQTSP